MKKILTISSLLVVIFLLSGWSGEGKEVSERTLSHESGDRNLVSVQSNETEEYNLLSSEREYVLMCGEGLRVNGEVKANGPLADVYSGGDVRVGGRLIVTGDLIVRGNYVNSGTAEITGDVITLSEPLTIPTVDLRQFYEAVNYLFTDEEGGTVYEYDEDGNLIRRVTGGHTLTHREQSGDFTLRVLTKKDFGKSREKFHQALQERFILQRI